MGATHSHQYGSQADNFDPSVIESLFGIMSDQAVRSLLADMVRDAESRLQRLAEVQLSPASMSVIKQDAHDLKSMGGNFGLMGLSHCAGDVERAARAGSVESVQTALPKLLSMGRQSINSLVQRHEIHCERAS